MARDKIEISGPGDSTIVQGRTGEVITVQRLFLTFSHSKDQAQRIEFKSGSDTIAGPLYVLDGGWIRYTRGENVDYDIKKGDSFIISLADGLSAAGNIEYNISGEW